jgi:hypothetical protein
MMEIGRKGRNRPLIPVRSATGQNQYSIHPSIESYNERERERERETQSIPFI